MTSDTKATAQDQASMAPEASRARPWRVLGRAGALVLLLGAGWIAGVKTHETIDVAQVLSTAWTQVATFGAALESAATRMASWTTTPRARGAGVVTEGPPATPASEGAVERTTGKIDQVRAASEAAVEQLRGTIDRVAISAESNHGELATKLEDLRERLDRIERNAPSTAGPVLSKLEQLDERLDRIERSTAVA